MKMKMKHPGVGKKKDKQSKLNEQELLSRKVATNKILEQRYPYVRIEGNWSSPTSVKIVNAHFKEDESEGKLASRLTKVSQYVDQEHRNKAAKVGFSSTLNEKYDTTTRDPSWICIFCHMHTHVAFLGDLYGPYYIQQSANLISHENTSSNPKQQSDVANTSLVNLPHTPQCHSSPAKVKSKKPSPKSKNVSEEHTSNLGVSTLPHDTLAVMNTPSVQEKTEVWFHESCLVWAPGVCLIPPRLVGLDKALSDSKQMVCIHCHESGGHVFCRQRGCGNRTHVPCALANGWVMNEIEFISLCPLHLVEQ